MKVGKVSIISQLLFMTSALAFYGH